MPLVREVVVEGFKSIRKLSVELGRVNVLIGANGSGKSNLLEAIAYGVAAARGKLDNEYLVPRGIRVADARFMRPAFAAAEPSAVAVSFRVEGKALERIEVDPEAPAISAEGAIEAFASKVFAERDKYTRMSRENFATVLKRMIETELKPHVQLLRGVPENFLIYGPENSALRIFQPELQVFPIGVRGEGLFAHLKALSTEKERFKAILDGLSLLEWFEDLEVPGDLAAGEHSLRIRDRYIAEGALFDQRSANEGFLFVLFYLTLFVSTETPAFFAIDNVDASLNPKLATTVVKRLIELAKTFDKQVIFTTHSPAVLDALDLSDDEQRLFVAERGKDGATRVRRIPAPTPLPGDAPVALSEAFARGYLGGLPKNF